MDPSRVMETFNLSNSEDCPIPNLSLIRSSITPDQISNHEFLDAVASGDLEIVQWYFNHQDDINISINIPLAIAIAAQYGYLEIIIWLVSTWTDPDWYTPYSLDWAVQNRHYEVIHWLHHHRPDTSNPGADEYSEVNLIDAAKYGSLIAVQWLWPRDQYKNPGRALLEAIIHNHLDVVKWLSKHCPDNQFPSILIDFAAREGHLEMVKWLVDNYRDKISPTAIQCSLQNGHYQVFDYLMETYPRLYLHAKL